MAEAAPWLWLGGSFILAIVATQVSWHLWQRESGRARLTTFADSPVFPYLFHFVRFLYYVGLPLAALVWGRDAVVGGLVGLQSFSVTGPADWVRDAGWAVGLGIGAWAILAAGWWAVRRARGDLEPVGTREPAWVLLREAAFHEAHWGFYRSAPIFALRQWLDATLAAYWGAWIGLGLVLLEAALNPWWRSGLRDQDRLPSLLVRCGLATLSTALYLQTGNLWVILLTHWAVSWGLAAWVRRISARPAVAAQSELTPQIESPEQPLSQA